MSKKKWIKYIYIGFWNIKIKYINMIFDILIILYLSFIICIFVARNLQYLWWQISELFIYFDISIVLWNCIQKFQEFVLQHSKLTCSLANYSPYLELGSCNPEQPNILSVHSRSCLWYVCWEPPPLSNSHHQDYNSWIGTLCKPLLPLLLEGGASQYFGLGSYFSRIIESKLKYL